MTEKRHMNKNRENVCSTKVNVYITDKTEDVTPKQEYIPPKATDIMIYIVDENEVSKKIY